MSRFKVGDRVRVVTRRFQKQHGLTGTVRAVREVTKSRASLNLQVKYDLPLQHNLGPSNSYHDDDVELILQPTDYDVLLKEAGDYYAAVTEAAE